MRYTLAAAPRSPWRFPTCWRRIVWRGCYLTTRNIKHPLAELADDSIHAPRPISDDYGMALHPYRDPLDVLELLRATGQCLSPDTRWFASRYRSGKVTLLEVCLPCRYPL